MTVDYSLIQETIRYCKNHCDTDEELATVVWVEEKIQEMLSTTLARQITSRVKVA